MDRDRRLRDLRHRPRLQALLEYERPRLRCRHRGADAVPPRRWEAPFDLTDDHHVYGLEWNEDLIRWYVDGEPVREMENTRWHQPLYLNLDAETQPDWFGLPDNAELPATFSIDYVRSWQRQ